MYKDPTLSNTYHVWFGIHGFEISPEKLTDLLGVTPTETRVKGATRTVGKGKFARERVNKENAWLLKSDLPRNESLEKHLEHLLEKIKPHEEAFKKITSKNYSEFGCAPYYYEANPGLQFENKLLKEIADLGTRLDLDIYCLAGTFSQFEQKDADKELTKQLSELKTVSDLGDNEPQTLAKSLIEIDAARSDLGMHMEDLVVWDDLEDEYYKEKMNKVTEDLKRIIKAIKQSKSLKEVLND